MDKNTIIGFLLIAALLFGYSWLNQPSQEELAQSRYNDSIAYVQAQEMKNLLSTEQESTEEVSDSAVFDAKIKSKLLKDQNTRPETIKRRTLSDTNHSKIL